MKRLKIRTANAKLGGPDGSELVEFAMVLPLLVVLIVGLMDFGGAFNAKQILNNAAREGARYAANQNSDILDLESASAAQAVGNVVQNYLSNAGLKACTFTPPASPTTTYTYTGSPSGCSLVINRAYDVTGTGTEISTHVTLSYPYTWTIGRVIRLLPGTGTLNLPTTISTDAVMQNIN